MMQREFSFPLWVLASFPHLHSIKINCDTPAIFWMEVVLNQIAFYLDLVHYLLSVWFPAMALSLIVTPPFGRVQAKEIYGPVCFFTSIVCNPYFVESV